MARLIDGEKLKNEVASTFHGAIGLTVTGAVHEIIDRQPTIDPESLRPTAHWISDSLYVDGKRKLLQWCSLCNCPGLRKTKYCPHCGAKMEDKSDD